MAVILETSIKRFRGLSTDDKPGIEKDAAGVRTKPPPVGSVFTETDTGDRYIWRGSWPWVRQEQAIESMFEKLFDVNQQILQVLSEIKRGHEEYLWENEMDPE